MRFEKKLSSRDYSALWTEYCGFLDLSIEDYMRIQNRLMEEQIALWSDSVLGKRLLGGRASPKTVDEFRAALSLTDYSHYADILLGKHEALLPEKPILWIQTTWEGGKYPVKTAPYTKGMLEAEKNNIISCFILSTSSAKGRFHITAHDKFLYGMAPLPYATGLIPLLMSEEITLDFLPSAKEAENMSFSEKNKRGFELGLKHGIDLFFALGSVASFITQNLSTMMGSKGGSLKKLLKLSPSTAMRYLKARHRAKVTGTPMLPRDLFHLKGFVVAGTDCRSYKKSLEEGWGVRPLEVAAGTEPTCIATESWTRNGLYFFPDACFYEFIPEREMYKNLIDPSYEPRTYLMDEVVPNQNYELVLSVLRGGAFARYRVGDMYRCLEPELDPDSPTIPRFEFVDRVPTLIDIAGFTRITEHTIEDVVRLSGLGIENWIAAKEYTADNRPYLHLYVEMKQSALESGAISKQILHEHLSIYFKYYDNDYNDLKRLLGMDPLEITILKTGTFELFRRRTDKTIFRINPPHYDKMELLAFQERDYSYEGLVKKR